LNINDGTTPAVISGSWVSIDVPMNIPPWSNNLTRNDIAQFLITSNLDVVYVDNIYFYKGTALSADTFEKASFTIYPNPSNGIVNLSSDSVIENVKIYNTLGQIVVSETSTSNEVSLNVSDLSSGVYVVTAQVGNELVRKQFIKE